MELIPDPRELLQPEMSMSMASWYAAPLTQASALELQHQARQLIQRTLANGGSDLPLRLADMIAGYWLGRRVIHDYRSLVAILPENEQAAVELVYGQLLMSRKQAGAMQHLDRGFALATPRLAPAAYFILLRRHALLRNLMLTVAGVAPQRLPDLLQEARVILRLRPGGGLPSPHYNPHDDTLG